MTLPRRESDYRSPSIRCHSRSTLDAIEGAQPQVKDNTDVLPTPVSTRSNSLEENHRPGDRPESRPLPRRLSSQVPPCAASSRPKRQLQWKSSSAIPTLSTTSATSSGTATPRERSTFSYFSLGVPRMAAPDTAADLLRQAITHK